MSVTIRRMTAADIEMGDSLRALAGWNQTLADWRRILSMEPDGCFVAEWDGQAVGTTSTTCYGTDLAWVGMVLVHPDYRGRGIGRALMDHCLAHLHKRGIRSIMLDATPLGEILYTKLGFTVASRLARWERSSVAAVCDPGLPEKSLASKRCGVLAATQTDLPGLVQVDARVFGVARQPLIRELARSNLATLVSDANPASAFGMIRAGVTADYLGPVESENPELARQLIQALLERTERPVFWDIPDANSAAIQLAEEFDFRHQRPLARMVFGAAPPPGMPDWQYAIADPACG